MSNNFKYDVIPSVIQLNFRDIIQLILIEIEKRDKLSEYLINVLLSPKVVTQLRHAA